MIKYILKREYDPNIVLLSIAVAFLGSYITICLCEQFRQKKLPDPLSSAILGERGLIAMMAVSLGGVAIWSMHFIGMSAINWYILDYPPIELRYNNWKTSVSMIAVVILEFLGLYISSFDPMFGKSKKEIIDLYVQHASKMSIAEVQKISPFKMMWIISTQSLGNLILGGFFAGSGLVVMQVLGIWAMETQGSTIEWDAGIVAAAVLVTMIGSLLAFWILFRLLSLYSNWESLRVLSALIMTAAVCGNQYITMAAPTVKIDPFSSDTVNFHESSGGDKLYVFSELTAFTLSFILFIIVIVEIRTQHHWLATEHRKDKHQTVATTVGKKTAANHASHLRSPEGTLAAGTGAQRNKSSMFGRLFQSFRVSPAVSSTSSGQAEIVGHHGEENV